LVVERPVEHLQELEGLGAGRGAHVEHDMVGLDVEEEGGDHGDHLLARDAAVLVGALDELVDALEAGTERAGTVRTHFRGLLDGSRLGMRKGGMTLSYHWGGGGTQKQLSSEARGECVGAWESNAAGCVCAGVSGTFPASRNGRRRSCWRL